MRRAWLLTVAAVGLGTLDGVAADDPPVKSYEVVIPKEDGIIATALNDRGDLIGFQWVEEQPGVLTQAPFFARGDAMTYLPLLEGYTATFPADVSNDGLVVGRSSKPSLPGVAVFMRNQAFVWDAQRGMRGLGVLDGDTASFATGVSRDGRRISGLAIGPDRVRACVWDRDGDGDTWTGSALPQESATLGSQVVVISGDGNRVAADDGEQACLWSRADDGTWDRRVIAERGGLIPRAVNDDGTVVGLRYDGDGTTQAVLWSRDGGYREIKEPPGYVKSEALDINNAGVVVGMIDGPAGSEVGPNAFVHQDGTLRILDEAGPNFTTATAINNRGQVAGVLDSGDEEAPDDPRQAPENDGRGQ